MYVFLSVFICVLRSSAYVLRHVQIEAAIEAEANCLRPRLRLRPKVVLFQIKSDNDHIS